ncbi:conserved hypothetical protein [Theileria orientalis strain Shintoku]|uniref:Uncharacterized protein n=1 Tax=Theileria orientalis strain Shintoku TaxID=869250 RepID=J4DQA4_THEOR|nr:conserved hypothetical protein [Theileria orientalis strain Shintoku]BAM42109.1 conserved hypothetical protein [Theileria orientalis strain Shintoku]|eukprot:XP_009692410.1 conserved hypothetical protein [Theileria orientalis strain Shintoku]
MAKKRPNKKNVKSKNVKKKRINGSDANLKRNPKDDKPGKQTRKNQPSKKIIKTENKSIKDISENDIKKFTTLEQYKQYISQICTQAITYPETHLKQVNLLYNVIEKKGTGTESLLNHVKKLAILSLVSVVSHLLPRVSHELNQVDQEVVRRTETAHSANIIDQERQITTRTIETRDRLTKYIKANLSENPDLFVPLISRLVKADNRVSDDLLTLCLKYSKVSESCLKAISELFQYGSMLDIHRYLKFIFKSQHINHKVIRIINDIQINKKQHEYVISEETSKPEENKQKSKKKHDKYKNEILIWIITFYTKTLREGKDFNMVESCIEGLGKYGLILEESIQLELLAELRKALNTYIERDSRNHRLVISGVNTVIKLVKVVKNFEYNWMYEIFTSLCRNIAPVLIQGELTLNDGSKLNLEEIVTKNEENRSVFFTHPCYTQTFLKSLDNLSNLLVKSTIIADFQVLTDLVQVLISLCLQVDSNVALSLMCYVNEIINKVPKLRPLISKEGIVFSILTKGKTSYWELSMMKSHYLPHLKSMFSASKDSNTISLKNKPPSTHMDPKEVETGKYFNCAGLDMYQILFPQNFTEYVKNIR